MLKISYIQGCHYKEMPASSASKTFKKGFKRQKQKAQKILAVRGLSENLTNLKSGSSSEVEPQSVTFNRAPLERSQIEISALEVKDFSSDESELIVNNSKDISDKGVTALGNLAGQTVQPGTMEVSLGSFSL